ncbi:MAG: DNA-binding response regulator [Verrucomicrobia bacterium]|nr:DNA-binding response regulator [Verrucomicrobiota bacterium]
MPAQKRKILVIDDHPIVRQGVSRLIAEENHFLVCGEASTWGEAMDLLAATRPDAVVLDISLGKRMGLDLIREMTALVPELRILVLSMHDEMVYAERSLRAGAHGYLMKSDATHKIPAALDHILAGGVYVSHRLTGLLLGRSMQSTDGGPRPGVQSLTNRELEVLSLVGQGLSSEAIATRLFLSLKTIEAHRSNIRNKLGLETGERLLEVAIRYTRDLR